jgi:uncharacterized cupin superfamily protein
VLARVNLLRDQTVYDDTDPEGYLGGRIHVSQALGADGLAVKLMEMPAGQSVCPYHYEYEEEWLVVLDGAVSVRTPDGEHALERGDIVRFPTGPAGAHKVTNAGEASARVLMFSSAREPSVAVYPDSDKIGVWPGNAEDTVMLHRRDGAVEYWDGEGS